MGHADAVRKGRFAGWQRPTTPFRLPRSIPVCENFFSTLFNLDSLRPNLPRRLRRWRVPGQSPVEIALAPQPCHPQPKAHNTGAPCPLSVRIAAAIISEDSRHVPIIIKAPAVVMHFFAIYCKAGREPGFWAISRGQAPGPRDQPPHGIARRLIAVELVSDETCTRPLG